MSKLNALIIGAGNIAAKYDSPDSPKILTYAHAITVSPSFSLVGFVDIDFETAVQATNIWGGYPYQSIEDALQGNDIDVAIVAVPDVFHYKVLKQISNLPLKGIIAEKPLAKTFAEATELIEIYKNSEIPVVVDYSRRFVPEFSFLRNQIQNGDYGQFLTGIGYYGKGLVHNGSHMIDLIQYLLGSSERVNFVSHEFDFFEDDPSISAILTYGLDKPFYLQHINCNNYYIFDVDLFFEKKRVKILDSDGKIELYELKPHEIYPEYTRLSLNSILPISFDEQLTNILENLSQKLLIGEDLKCTMNDAYETLRTCNLLIEQFQI